jgi:sulfonate transport system substrate-binding protein
MKKLVAVVLAACVCASAVAGCGSSSQTGSTTEQAETTEAEGTVDEEITAVETAEEEAQTSDDLDKLVFTYVTSPLNIPTIVEKENGIFAENLADLGIDVDYAEITSGADQTQALASGDVQVLYAVGATSVILSAANGADIKVLNMYSRSPEAFCLYSKDDSISSPEDLKGKTIAGPVGTNLHELLVAYLATADLTIDDVDFVNMTIPDARAGLENGSVDVAMLAGANAYQADKAGFNLVTNGDGLIKAIIAVAVTDEFYQAHPDVIERLEKAQEEIAAFMEENPEETTAMVAAALDLDEEAVQDMAAYYDFSTELTEDDIAGFQKTADFMLESGMIENAVDVNTLFYK